MLEPIDLIQRIRLGMNALLGGLDCRRNHMPYWNCYFDTGKEDLKAFSHDGAWDHCHDVPRAIHALCMAEDATGDRIPQDVFDDLVESLFALFSEDDCLPGAVRSETGERFVHLHSMREVIHASTALMGRRDKRAEYWARKMVRVMRQAFDESGEIHTDRLPDYMDRPYTHQPQQEGRSVDALVRYYRVSGDDVALELAGLMTRYALEHCFTSTGMLTQAAGYHTHSITAMVAGMLDLAVLTNNLALLQRVKAIYDVGLPSFCSSFGWSKESLQNTMLQGESNNTGDLLRAALILGRAGYPEYFEHAERMLRSHLLPSQVIDVDGWSDNPSEEEDRLRSLASRIRGGFSFPEPNDLLFQDPVSEKGTEAPSYPIVTFDITSGAVDALCEAWRSIVTEDEAGIRINLLFDRKTGNITIRSFLSGEGRVDVENRSGRNLFLRIPSWVLHAEVRTESDAGEQPSRFSGGYLVLPASISRCSIRFPMRKQRTEESIAYRWHKIDWRGDQIMAMSPRGKYLPMFPASADSDVD